MAKYPSPDYFWMDYFSKKWGYTFQVVSDLGELFQHASPYIKGAVRIGNLDANVATVAATLAGLKDLIPVTDITAKRWPSLAQLPVVEDLRQRFPQNATPETKLQSLEWAVKELLPQTNSKTLFSYYTGQYGYISFDYAIAQRMFCYNLSHVDPNATDAESRKILEKPWSPSGLPHADEARLVEQIFAHLEPYGMVWGWDAQSENAISRMAGKNGSAATCCGANNISFHASAPARSPMMPRQRRLNPESVNPEEKYYIAFVSGAGDTAHTATGLMCNGRWVYSGRGKVPMNWTISPYLVKIMPGLMEAYYEQCSPNDYFVNETSGYGYTHPSHIPDDFLWGYAERMKEASVWADTHYTDLWWHKGITPESKLRKWQAATGMDGFFSWQQPQRVVYPDQGPLEIQSERYFTDYWPPGDPKKTPQALADSLVAQLKDVPKPWFTVIYDVDPNFAAATMALLPPDQFKAVLMDEFFLAAAKAKAKVQGRKVMPLPAPKVN